MPTKDEEYIRARKARQLMIEIDEKHAKNQRVIVGCLCTLAIFIIFCVMVVATSVNIYCLTAVMFLCCIIIMGLVLYGNDVSRETKRPQVKVRRRHR